MGKNNHFVPRRYLRRFRSVSDRQVALYNIKSRRVIEVAAIGDQCYRDYFYTKNPAFEAAFTKLENAHEGLYERMIADEFAPAPGSVDRNTLSAAIMFQEGRTFSALDRANHLAGEFIKSALRVQLEKTGKADLIEYLPQVKVSLTDGIMDTIQRHLSMYPLIDDLDCTLFVNRTTEDFLTCDHPIALGNNLAQDRPSGASVGFSSRGLVIVNPLSPRALVLLSDREVYKVTRNARGVAYLTNHQEVVGLNLAQCSVAHVNLYFASETRVRRTLDEFEKHKTVLRADPPPMTETPMQGGGRTGILLGMKRTSHHIRLPKVVEIRGAAKTGRYALGDAFIRDPIRAMAVRAELDRVHRLRQAATERADRAAQSKDSKPGQTGG
jgi:Arc/MetJ-type ribon-helix-helix transcriptional regulator